MFSFSQDHQFSHLYCTLMSLANNVIFHFLQIRIAALNAASAAADESEDPLKTKKSRTKEAQVW